jgi:hypothetical protein
MAAAASQAESTSPSSRALSAARDFRKYFSSPTTVGCENFENAPRDPLCLLKRHHGFAEIIVRGVVVLVERLRV